MCVENRQWARRHLVGTVILGNLFAHDEDILIPDHLLLHSRVERIPDGHLVVAESAH